MNETLLSGDDANQSTPMIDPSKDYEQELVGEGKKFKTVKDLARGKYEADLYVNTLTRQLDEMREDYLKLREDYTARAKLEDLIGQLEDKQLQKLDSAQPKASEVKDNKPTIDPKAIESLVSSKIQEYELTKKQTENFNTVRNKLREQFGDNYQNVLKNQIEDLGLTEEDVNMLARKSPSAFFKAIGVEQAPSKTTYQNPVASSQRPETFKPKGAPKRTWSYYQDLKKTNPNLYLDPKTNVQMHNDAIELGEAFFDTD
jgi:hypothetical protein